MSATTIPRFDLRVLRAAKRRVTARAGRSSPNPACNKPGRLQEAPGCQKNFSARNLIRRTALLTLRARDDHQHQESYYNFQRPPVINPATKLLMSAPSVFYKIVRSSSASTSTPFQRVELISNASAGPAISEVTCSAHPRTNETAVGMSRRFWNQTT
jgi:hypothetical protein